MIKMVQAMRHWVMPKTLHGCSSAACGLLCGELTSTANHTAAAAGVTMATACGLEQAPVVERHNSGVRRAVGAVARSEALAGRGARLLAFVAPMHPIDGENVGQDAGDVRHRAVVVR